MKEKFVNCLTTFVTNNKNCDEITIKTIRYGLEGVYLSLTKFIVTFILVCLTNTIVEFLLFLIFYLCIRKYSFGLHANSSLMCWITTLPIFVGGSLLIKYLSFNINVTYLLWIISFTSFLMWAPADTPKRPLIREKQRKKQKLKTCIISIIYLVLIIFIKHKIIINAIILSLVLQALLINPFIYKITNTRFNNYSYYNNKV